MYYAFIYCLYIPTIKAVGDPGLPRMFKLALPRKASRRIFLAVFPLQLSRVSLIVWEKTAAEADCVTHRVLLTASTGTRLGGKAFPSLPPPLPRSRGLPDRRHLPETTGACYRNQYHDTCTASGLEGRGETQTGVELPLIDLPFCAG